MSDVVFTGSVQDIKKNFGLDVVDLTLLVKKTFNCDDDTEFIVVISSGKSYSSISVKPTHFDHLIARKIKHNEQKLRAVL